MSNKIDFLKRRSEFLRQIREYFFSHDVWEVDTPVMSQFGNPDPALLNFVSYFNGPGKLYKQNTFLITSPEYHMKRLLAEESGSIYYLGKVFRDGELSKKHNPEFTLLEWYRVHYDLMALIEEVVTIIHCLSNLTLNVHIKEYRAVFMDYLNIDPFEITKSALIQLVEENGISLTFDPKSKDECLDILMTHCIEPLLPKEDIYVIYHYPESQASLAKIIEKDYGLVGKRFEVYWRGLELANGYEELTDRIEQEKRFKTENIIRTHYGYSSVPIDEYLLAKLEEMPPLCSGVALGVDRLLMAIEQVENIGNVIAFSFEES